MGHTFAATAASIREPSAVPSAALLRQPPLCPFPFPLRNLPNSVRECRRCPFYGLSGVRNGEGKRALKFAQNAKIATSRKKSPYLCGSQRLEIRNIHTHGDAVCASASSLHLSAGYVVGYAKKTAKKGCPWQGRVPPGLHISILLILHFSNPGLRHTEIPTAVYYNPSPAFCKQIIKLPTIHCKLKKENPAFCWENYFYINIVWIFCNHPVLPIIMLWGSFQGCPPGIPAGHFPALPWHSFGAFFARNVPKTEITPLYPHFVQKRA